VTPKVDKAPSLTTYWLPQPQPQLRPCGRRRADDWDRGGAIAPAADAEIYEAHRLDFADGLYSGRFGLGDEVTPGATSRLREAG
jgi:hypothetical protein